MIRRCINQVVYYASPLLEGIGVPHAFSTRMGGISPPPFDSMNLGNPMGCAVQDDDARIAQNYQILQTAIVCADRTRCWTHQVHGGEVLAVRRDEPFANSQKADALVSDDPSRLMSIRVADCVPILIATHDGACVAAVHAGWRGVIARVVPNAIAAMQSLRSVDVSTLLVAVGPCIGPDAFEVGPEVLQAFGDAFPTAPPTRPYADSSGQGTVDLKAAIRLQLLELGVSDVQIDLSDRCTVRDQDEFFSHRRDHGVTGRMAAVIGARSV